MSGDVVLVTGGTGAIGRPLLESLTLDGVPTAVLARRPDVEMPRGAVALHGDVTAGPRLGLASTDWNALRGRVSTIIHGAALTRFDAPLAAAREVNVTGTQHVLAFAADCPRLQRLVALSTVYVAGRRTGRIREHELEHDAGFVNAYEQSKFEGERLLRSAMAHLPIAVCRLSTVLGDSQTGRVERPAAIHHAIRFLYHSLLPMIPGSADSRVDLIASDYAVAAIRTAAGPGFDAGSTWHVSAGEEGVRQEELLDLVVDAFLRHRPAWRRRAIEKPAIVELETFDLFRASVDAVADPGLRASVAVLAPFAPQLAYPKQFDVAACAAGLAGQAVHRPDMREVIGRVVQFLIEHNWPGAEAGVACAT